MRLQDKVTIVTGAAGYLGRAYAVRMGQEGAKVVVADKADCGEVVELVQATGAEVLPVEVDVTSEESTQEMARKTVERFGRIDCLLNNAGLFRGPGMDARPILDVDLDAFRRTLDVNVTGIFLCIRAVFPYMRDQGHGKIINISSGTWLHTSRSVNATPHYVASKAAVMGLTRAVAKELGAYNIRVNTLAPGGMGLPGQDRAPTEQQQQQERTSGRAIQRAPVPEDLTGTAVFLFSEDSDWVTGQMIVVNGGMEVY